MDFAFYDGQVLPLPEVRFFPDDRAFFFGDGVYDAMVGNMREIYLLERHLARFRKSLSALSLTVEYSDCEIEEILRRLMQKVGGDMCFLYIQASRKKAERAHAIAGSHSSHFFAYAKRFSLPDENGRLFLVTTEDKRYELCHIKTINLLPNVLASTYAEERGADEAIFVKNNMVRECSHSNISILLNGVLYTHPLDCHILPGIMRGELISEAINMGISVVERPFSIEEMLRAEGVFVTSTTRRVAFAQRIDFTLLKEPSDSALALHRAVNFAFYEKMQKND